MRTSGQWRLSVKIGLPAQKSAFIISAARHGYRKQALRTTQTRIVPEKRPSWPECSRSQALASGRVGDFQAESLAAPELARAAAPPTGPPGSRDAVLKSPKADPRQSPVVLKPVAKRKILINGLVVLKGRYLGIQGDDLPDLLLVGEYVAELFLSRRSWTPFDKVCDR
jgi:hypothetical protein